MNSNYSYLEEKNRTLCYPLTNSEFNFNLPKSCQGLPDTHIGPTLGITKLQMFRLLKGSLYVTMFLSAAG